MQRVQVFLHEEQCVALQRLARFSGVAQSDLIRQGVELLLKRKQQQQQDWKQAAAQLGGIWQDHDGLLETQRNIRNSLNSRIQRFTHE